MRMDGRFGRIMNPALASGNLLTTANGIAGMACFSGLANILVL